MENWFASLRGMPKFGEHEPARLIKAYPVDPNTGDNAHPAIAYCTVRHPMAARIRATFLKANRLVTSRSKRWNGNFDSLPVEYLKGVMEKMESYGDRVQFSRVSVGAEPSYQIINTHDKTMAFDRNHHLLRPSEEEFAGVNATPFFTQEQVKAAIAGVRSASSSGSRTARVVRAGSGAPRTSAARLEEQFAAQRYEYFRNNRQNLPPTISEHTDEITALMKQGKSAEDAFGEVLKKYY